MWVEAKMHAEQVRCHWWFVHEHLAEATLGNQDAVRQILAREGVKAVIADQCMCGLLTWRKNGKAMPARKRTKFMTNCPEIRRIAEPMRSSQFSAGTSPREESSSRGYGVHPQRQSLDRPEERRSTQEGMEDG